MNFIKEGGWGMYPVLIFGIATLIVAVRQLVDHSERRNLTALWTMGLTMAAGVLGTATGMQTSARFLHQTTEKWLWFVGLQESLNNLVLAVVMVTIAMLMMLAAHLRAAPPAGEAAGAKARKDRDDEQDAPGARRHLTVHQGAAV